MTGVDMTKLEPIEELRGEDVEETEELRALARNAKQFITGFPWCAAIERGFSGVVIPSVIGTFLFVIRPTKPDIDTTLWVIVGDVPPAYLVVDEATSPALALKKYVELMSAWVNAVEQGDSVEDLIPVNVPPMKEYAAKLRTRLIFIQERILPEYSDDFKA